MAKNVQKESKFPGLMQDLKPTSTQEYTYTHTDTPTPVQKERKTKRVQLLLKPSTVDQLDAYAKIHDTSRNDIIQNLVEEFLHDKQ